MKTVLVAAALAVLATAASAQDKRPDYGTAVNAAGAKKIAADVLAECQKNSWNVAVAVVDNHGFLVYFERMDNTQTASMDIAVGKARAAAAETSKADRAAMSWRGAKPNCAKAWLRPNAWPVKRARRQVMI